MVKGAAIKFVSYKDTVPKLLSILKLENEIKKYDKIILKPSLQDLNNPTSPEFVEPILSFCMKNKNPVAELFIAEGADGIDTFDLFESLGYKKLAEKYNIGLIDLNHAETEEIINDNFTRFESVYYPKILKESFVISLAKPEENLDYGFIGSISGMLGAFPASKYSGLFSSKKSKIRKWPLDYSIHDIIQCKIPEFAVLDASSKGLIFAGQPLEIDKQSLKSFEKDFKSIKYLRMIDETINKE